jgi:hypothetical protein
MPSNSGGSRSSSERVTSLHGRRVWTDGAGVVVGRRVEQSEQVLPPLRIESLADGIITGIATPGMPSLIK